MMNLLRHRASKSDTLETTKERGLLCMVRFYVMAIFGYRTAAEQKQYLEKVEASPEELQKAQTTGRHTWKRKTNLARPGR